MIPSLSFLQFSPTFPLARSFYSLSSFNLKKEVKNKIVVVILNFVFEKIDYHKYFQKSETLKLLMQEKWNSKMTP